MSSSTKINLEQSWNKATLTNNFIFYKVMRYHPEACKHLLEMLLNVKIHKMEMHNEETIDLDHDKKGIRLDIYVKENKRIYDIEMQVAKKENLPKRARYYAGLMALDSLGEGDPYNTLRDSHVIFLCLKDLFNHGLPVYTFENICQEDSQIKLNDRDFKHFFIVSTCAKMIKDGELKSFFDFLVTNKPNNEFTTKLKDYVDDAKQNMQWRHQYMTYLRQRNSDLEEGREEGREEGFQQKAVEVATKMLVKEYPLQEIVDMTGLPLEQVLELQKKIKVPVNNES